MRTLFLLTALVLAASTAQAKPEKGKVFGDWRIDCETQPGQPERCFAMQEQVGVPKTPDGQPAAKPAEPKRIIKVSIGYLGRDYKPTIVAILPLGIFLPAGVAYQLDGGTQKPFQVQRCLPDGCIAGAEFDEATWQALPAGQRLLVGMKSDPAGQTIVIPVSLKGLDAAIASLK